MSIFNKEPRDRTESAELLEKRKTPEGRAEDIAYTINHAIVCAATDVIDPFIGAYSQAKFGHRIGTSFCNKTHDHSHDHTHSHDDHGTGAHSDHSDHDKHVHSGSCGHSSHDNHKDHTKHHGGSDCTHHIAEDRTKPFGTRFKAALWHWGTAEFAGDVGAVPITIAAQRFAPGMMSSIGHGIEHIVGNDYRNSAKKASREWAEKQGIALDDERVKERENDIYNHEVDHFGQVGVWTVASTALNIAWQRYVTKNHSVSLGDMLLYKTLGAAQTAGILMVGRAKLPEQFHDFDRWTTKNIYLPTTKLIGLDSDAVENVIQKHEDLHGHAKHTHDEQEAASSPQPKIDAQDASSNVLVPEHLQR